MFELGGRRVWVAGHRGYDEVRVRDLSGGIFTVHRGVRRG